MGNGNEPKVLLNNKFQNARKIEILWDFIWKIIVKSTTNFEVMEKKVLNFTKLKFKFVEF